MSFDVDRLRAVAAGDLEAPLVDEIEDDPSQVDVTLVYRDADADWVVPAGLAGAKPGCPELERVDGTDLWAGTYRVGRDTRTLYRFQLGSDWTDPRSFRHDSFNPRTFTYLPDRELGDKEPAVFSLLELPEAPPFRWADSDGAFPAGTVEEERVASERLGNERRVYVYTPPGYDSRRAYPLVLLFDGWSYSHWISAPRTLDALIATGAVPPLVAALPDSLDHATRLRELQLDEPFREFVVDGLLPWARGRLSVSEDPADIVAAGSSLGGLTATYTALARPDLFGAVISLSGSYQTSAGQTLVRRLAEEARRPLRFFVAAGALETGIWPGRPAPSLLHANRHLRDVMVAKGYDARYVEYPGGHDYIWWRELLAEGLAGLLGGR